MKKDLPAYVVRLKGVLYFKRRRWPTLKFVSQEVGPAFYAEYARITNGTAPKSKLFSVKNLISDYTRSKRFTDLKPRTRADYLKFLSRFERNAGNLLVDDIERKHVLAWQDQLSQSDGAHYANYFVRVIRVSFEYAIDRGQIAGNPAKGVKSIKYKTRKPQPWPQEAINSVRETLPHDHRTRLLFELLYCTGQRIGDVLSAKWIDIHGPAISVNQNKSGADLELIITEDLAECLRRAKRHHSVETILANHRGNGPWSYRGAADAMMKLRKQVGAVEHNIHDIRHTVASEIASAGLDDEHIQSVTGHTTKKMAAHYSASTRQKTRAKTAQSARNRTKTDRE